MKRYYKSYAGIIGTEPEYGDCKAAVTENTEKYKYTTADYPCAKPRELEAYAIQNVDNNIADCYQDILSHKITHASKHQKVKLGDVGLALKIPGYIDRSGESTFYNVNKDCTITVTTVSLYTGLIKKQEIMSRGAFNSKYHIDDSPPPAEPAPKPGPAPADGDGGGLGALEDIVDKLMEPPYIYIVGGAGVLVAVLIVGKAIR